MGMEDVIILVVTILALGTVMIIGGQMEQILLSDIVTVEPILFFILVGIFILLMGIMIWKFKL